MFEYVVSYVLCALAAAGTGSGGADDSAQFGTSGQAIARLVKAYPDFLKASEKPNTVLWKDGTEMVFDDHAPKAGFEDMLNRASLKDQMSQVYRPGWPVSPPQPDEDPGRARHEPFFRKMYGNTEEAVRKHLASVRWLPGAEGTTVLFTRVNGADRALEQVAREIEKLPPEVKRYVAKPDGTFVWRPIAGTKRLSMHSFGAAIDFALPKAVQRYWKWDTRDRTPPPYPEAILQDEKLGQIVKIFERHGFIWGGKWHHYDMVHFEYRPELLDRSPE
jgi:hypothetical protein